MKNEEGGIKQEKFSVLLIGHGSRLPYNREMADLHAELLRKKGYKVYTAFNEMSDPTIEVAMKAIVDDGAEEIVALPLFVASGVHTEHDIPIKLGLPEGYGTGISTRYGRKVTVHYKEPFGDDPGVTQVLLDKLNNIGCSDSTGVLLIAHGSPMKHNSGLVNRTSERLRVAKIKNVFVGFNEYNEPSIEGSFEEMVDAGFDRIIVLPMFIASGAHIGEEIPEKLGIPGGSSYCILNKGGREVAVYYAETLGLNPGMNDILVKKLDDIVIS
ncbi:MAG: sirohydrochlorin cobaltochelatase [Methanomassiliicoccaceae archaeon]|nr:sirohydrochlorin cobaltochelatase [Methanomassiliicoccaceae archaeon]